MVAMFRDLGRVHIASFVVGITGLVIGIIGIVLAIVFGTAQHTCTPVTIAPPTCPPTTTLPCATNLFSIATGIQGVQWDDTYSNPNDPKSAELIAQIQTNLTRTLNSGLNSGVSSSSFARVLAVGNGPMVNNTVIKISMLQKGDDGVSVIAVGNGAVSSAVDAGALPQPEQVSQVIKNDTTQYKPDTVQTNPAVCTYTNTTITTLPPPTDCPTMDTLPTCPTITCPTLPPMTAPTCPSAPVVTCPTCPTCPAITCPAITCPTVPVAPTSSCAPCPSSATPSPSCPTCPTCPTLPCSTSLFSVSTGVAGLAWNDKYTNLTDPSTIAVIGQIQTNLTMALNSGLNQEVPTANWFHVRPHVSGPTSNNSVVQVLRLEKNADGVVIAYGNGAISSSSDATTLPDQDQVKNVIVNDPVQFVPATVQTAQQVCSLSTPPPPTSAPSTAAPSSPTTPEFLCQHPTWSFTFLLAYSNQMPLASYTKMVDIVVAGLNGENVLRDAYLDSEDQVVRQPKDLSSFTQDLQQNPPNPTASSSGESNLVKMLQNFIPTAQETSEYSGKTTNWLENSILLLLPSFLPFSNSTDLAESNYTSFVNRNVKVFIVMEGAEFETQNGKSWTDFAIFERLTTRTNGHFIVGSFDEIVPLIMNFGYRQDLVFSRNYRANLSIGNFFTWNSNGDVEMTVSISTDSYLAPPDSVTLSFESDTGEVKSIDIPVHQGSNFYTQNLTLSANTLYSITTTSTSNLFIRIWTPRKYYQYAEYVDLELTPSEPNDVEGAAFRMTLLNNCYQNERAKLIISDGNGEISKKYDSLQVSGAPIGTEGSYPKFAFVPFFCSSSCENYNVQLIVGEYSIMRSFECLHSSEPLNPKCKNLDENGNYYCDREKLPFKRGPTGRLTDCLGHGKLEFDSEDTQDYICNCNDGYSGVSCQDFHNS